MGVKVRGSGFGGAAAIALSELTRWGHFRVEPTLGLGNDVVYPVMGLPSSQASTAFVTAGIAPVRANAQSRKVYQLTPTLLNGSQLTWVGENAASTAAELIGKFRDTFNGLEAARPLGEEYATVTQAWIRKGNNTDPVWARQRWGFIHGGVGPLGNDANTPTVGVIGDGNVGFRLGSVNCPDGAAAGATTPGAIDPNSVQPAALVNPGLKWFHVRVKMVPATPTSPAAIGIYLDGALVVTLNTLTNFPRGSLAVNRDYNEIRASCIVSFDGATQLNGLWIHRWEWWYDTDLTL